MSLVRRVIAPLNLIPSPHKSRLNFLGIRFIARVLLACSVYQAQVKLCTHSPSATWKIGLVQVIGFGSKIKRFLSANLHHGFRFRYSEEQAANFEKISQVFWYYLIMYVKKLGIFFSRFHGLLRISKLYGCQSWDKLPWWLRMNMGQILGKTLDRSLMHPENYPDYSHVHTDQW